MVTVFICLMALVLINVLLLIFSCNDTEKDVKDSSYVKSKHFFYKPTASGFRMTADK